MDPPDADDAGVGEPVVLAAVITGLAVLGGSTALQVVWLLAVGAAVALRGRALPTRAGRPTDVRDPG